MQNNKIIKIIFVLLIATILICSVSFGMSCQDFSKLSSKDQIENIKKTGKELRETNYDFLIKSMYKNSMIKSTREANKEFANVFDTFISKKNYIPTKVISYDGKNLIIQFKVNPNLKFDESFNDFLAGQGHIIEKNQEYFINQIETNKLIPSFELNYGYNNFYMWDGHHRFMASIETKAPIVEIKFLMEGGATGTSWKGIKYI